MMTVNEKTTLARFLDLTGDYFKDGHARDREYKVFADDTPQEEILPESNPESLSSLPLAYQVNENGHEHEYEEESVNETRGTEGIAAAVKTCEACGLAATRKNTVPGEGADAPLVMVIGEGPGADEDLSGRPFVGKAGQLLDKMLASIGLSRDKNCFIANMVKCRPPGNRDPKPEEITACFPFLEQQIALLRPRVILCTGRVAAQNLLKTGTGINALRGTFSEFCITETGETIPVLCTFHPSAILRDENLKRPAWEDLKLLKSKLK